KKEHASLDGFEKHCVHAVRFRREGVPASRVAGHVLLADATDRDALPLSAGLERGIAAGDHHPERGGGADAEREKRTGSASHGPTSPSKSRARTQHHSRPCCWPQFRGTDATRRGASRAPSEVVGAD